MSNTTRIADDGVGRTKLYSLKSNGHTFASRKDVPVADGNTKPDAVMVVARDEFGRLLVIQEDRPITGGLIWDIPAGMIDEGETPVEAAKREIYEETGLVLDNAELWKYNPFVSPGMVDETNAIVTGLVRGQTSNLNVQGDENINAFLMSADDMSRAAFYQPYIRMSARLALLLL